VIQGQNFGQTPGTVAVRGNPATVPQGDWGPNQIVAVMPDIPAGWADVAVTVPGASQQPLPGKIYVIQKSSGGGYRGTSGSSSTPASQPGGVATLSPTADSAPATPTPSNPGFIPPSDNGPIISTAPAPFVQTPKPAGAPVDVALSTPTDNALPGHDIPFTVTVTAFGKPVAGSTVELLLVYEPGDDAKITPAKGTTDESGQLKGTIHLSRTYGDHIILARSGQFSDEIRVTGRNARPAVNGTGGISHLDNGLTGLVPSQKTIIVGLLVICVILFVTGFAIQMAMPRHKMALATVGAPASRGTPRKQRVAKPKRTVSLPRPPYFLVTRSLGSRRGWWRHPMRAAVGPGRVAGAVLQFCLAMAIAAAGGALARLRGA